MLAALDLRLAPLLRCCYDLPPRSEPYHSERQLAQLLMGCCSLAAPLPPAALLLLPHWKHVAFACPVLLCLLHLVRHLCFPAQQRK